jgi:MFS family permease
MRRSLSQYLTVTGTYWGFTLSDGALRILVLFHFFKLGYSPFTLALLFLMYEAAGIIANLGGGWLATRFGIPRMLLLGIAMQILGLMFLSCLDPTFGPVLSVIWVLVAQGIAGLAKDITKTASKSAIKVVKIDEDEGLFRWVAWFTGSKNAMKGVGFFLGGVMLTTIGFRGGLWLMAGLLGLLAVLVVFTLPSKLGAGVASRTIKELFSKSSAVNTIALARIFLFGARDIWFVVALPVFLYGNGWSFWEVGGFLALWTMLYGLVQGMAPAIMRTTTATPVSWNNTVGWAVALALALIGILVCMIVKMGVPVLITGLLVFGVFFAVNSSLHSFLIVAYAGSKKAAEDIGFYYAANAAGRLAGTFLSGFLYYEGGLLACLSGSALFLVITALMVARLPQQEI